MKNKFLFCTVLLLLSKNAITPAHAVTPEECIKADQILCDPKSKGICANLKKNGLGALETACNETWVFCDSTRASRNCYQFTCDNFKKNLCSAPKS